MPANTLKRQWFTQAALLAALATTAGQTRADEQQASNGITASASLDYVSIYMFRGYEQLDSDQGLTLQPGIEFTLPVDDGIGLTVGTWGSIHTDTDGPGGGASNPKSWYEQDIYSSLGFDLGMINASLGLTYYAYPSSATNGNITELNLGLSTDPYALCDRSAFSAYIAVAVELQNNLLADENSYLELGGEYTFDLSNDAPVPVVLSIPVAIGFSLDDYYTNNTTGDNETFGYASIGLMGTLPLSSVLGTDQWLGAWDLTAGATFYFLNSSVALTDNFADSGDNYQVVAKVGISRSW